MRPDTLAVALEQGLGRPFGRRRLRTLKFAEQHARNTGVLGHEVDMRLEDRLQGGEGRCAGSGGPVDAGEQAIGDPPHDRLPDRVLGREVAEQCALCQLHVAGDRCRGDVAGVSFGRQSHHGFYGDLSTCFSGKMPGGHGHLSK